MLHGFGARATRSAPCTPAWPRRWRRAASARCASTSRVFGKSDGDTGSTTVTSQVADAEVAYQYLVGLDWVNPERIGVIGFSLRRRLHHRRSAAPEVQVHGDLVVGGDMVPFTSSTR
ncbi:MAG: hypothetical protein M9927_03840 [Anaerolineae bacterium]|nr:hypothetical protein [Anaerolineae bacterium]